MAGKKRKASNWKRAHVGEVPYFLNDEEDDAAGSQAREALPSDVGNDLTSALAGREDVKILETIREVPGETVEPAIRPISDSLPRRENEGEPEPSPHHADWAVEPFLAVGSNGADASWACEYDQPVGSPYAGLPISICIGEKETYHVPEGIANQIVSLPQRRDKSNPHVATFPEIDDRISHTFIHYLYTGQYQTLKASTAHGVPEGRIEYERSLLAYRAGSQCGLKGLAEHGKKYLRSFEKDIHVFDVLSLARRHIPRITEDVWFSEYLTAKILENFEAEEDLFEQEGFFKEFGEAPDFDKFLAKAMAKLYARKITSIRAGSGTSQVANELTPPIAAAGKHAVSEDGKGSTAPEDQKGSSKAAASWTTGEHACSNETAWWRLEIKEDTDDESSSEITVI